MIYQYLESSPIKPCPFCGIKPVRWIYEEIMNKWRISIMCDNSDCLADVQIDSLYRGPESESELEKEFVILESIWNTRSG